MPLLASDIDTLYVTGRITGCSFVANKPKLLVTENGNIYVLFMLHINLGWLDFFLQSQTKLYHSEFTNTEGENKEHIKTHTPTLKISSSRMYMS